MQIDAYLRRIMAEIDALFKAFADETRLRILNLLSREELCVNDIAKTLKLNQSKVSRHLTYLRYAGLVKAHRHGTRAFYAFENPTSRLKKILLDHFKKGIFEEVNIMKNDLIRLKTLKLKKGGFKE